MAHSGTAYAHHATKGAVIRRAPAIKPSGAPRRPGSDGGYIGSFTKPLPWKVRAKRRAMGKRQRAARRRNR